MKNRTIPNEAWQRNIFEKYFNSILLDEQNQPDPEGPYISISRDFGCMANTIASKLAIELSGQNPEQESRPEWKWLNKSILHESSKALELSPAKIKYVFHSKQKTTMDEVVSALSTRYYKSDKKIRNTIINIIRSIAKRGHVIIVGRGGVAFAADNPRSLHVKLTAPLEWRVNKISKNYNKPIAEARQYTQNVDRERKFLIDNFIGRDTDLSIFDLVLNRASLSEEEIVSTIPNLANSKGLTGT